MIIKDNNPKDSIYHIPADDNVKLIVENGKVKDLVIDYKKKKQAKRVIRTTDMKADSIRLEGGGITEFPYQVDIDTRMFEVEVTKGDVPHIW